MDWNIAIRESGNRDKKFQQMEKIYTQKKD